jgi:hypothetical protein
VSFRFGGLALLVLAAGCNASAQKGSDAPATSATAAASTAAAPANFGALAIEKKLPGTFASVSNVVEFGRGRVAFADARERRLYAGDFAAGTLDTLGTQADSGQKLPDGSYRLPGWVARLGGDSLALVDFAAIRTTVWSPEGRFARVMPLPMVAGPTPVLAYDTVGHAYKADLTSVMGGAAPGTRMKRDSLPVLRIDLKTGAADTIANMGGPDFGLATFGEQTQEVAKVFGPTDAFGTTPDGRIWVARARTQSVDWRAVDGTWTRGAPREWTRVPVTAADKQRVMDRLKERGLPAGFKIEFPFAESKPSFEVAFGLPSGEVWLQYSRASEDEAMRYGVFGTDGTYVREVTAPAGVQLVGFGASGAAYGVVKEADGRRSVVRLTPAP